MRLGRLLMPGLWIAMSIALAVAVPRLPWGRALAQASAIDPVWIGLAMLLNFTILPLWALEWTLLLPVAFRMSVQRMFGIVAVTASVLNSIPMLAGEASAVALLISHGSLTRGAALSVLAMDQLLVAGAKVAVLCAAALLAPVPEWLRAGLLLMSGALAAALAVLFYLAHRWEHVRQQLVRRESTLRRRVARLAEWGSHLDALRSVRTMVTVSALAVGKKSLEVLAVLAIQLAFGMEPSLAVAVTIVAALAISTLVPVSPGNLGVYEATVFAVYRFTGTATETALGLALVQHFCFLLPSIATGYLILTARQLVPRWRQAA